MSDVRAVAGTAHTGLGALSATASVRAVAGTAYASLGGLSAVVGIRSTIDAVAEVVGTPGASVVDLNTLAAVLRQAVAAGVSAGLAAQRVDDQTPMFGAVGRFLNANPGL